MCTEQGDNEPLADASSNQPSDHQSQQSPCLKTAYPVQVMITQPGQHQTCYYGQGQVLPNSMISAMNDNTEWQPHHLAWSVLNLLFCCLCFGIVAVVKSSHCRSARQAGDHERAATRSREARNWNIAATACGLVILALNLIRFIIIPKTDRQQQNLFENN